jgi:hypothetical protein
MRWHLSHTFPACLHTALLRLRHQQSDPQHFEPKPAYHAAHSSRRTANSNILTARSHRIRRISNPSAKPVPHPTSSLSASHLLPHSLPALLIIQPNLMLLHNLCLQTPGMKAHDHRPRFRQRDNGAQGYELSRLVPLVQDFGSPDYVYRGV